jgi:hypothetical protein
MDLPNLRHFTPEGVSSDPVEALVGEDWIPAVYTNHGWTGPDGANLNVEIAEWRDASKKGQVTECNLSQHQGGDEGGQTAKASYSNRTRQSRKKP